MQVALQLEKSVNQALLDLHKVADSKGDAQVSVIIYEYYLHKKLASSSFLATTCRFVVGPLKLPYNLLRQFYLFFGPNCRLLSRVSDIGPLGPLVIM